jgi:triacylglycerol esterase/lipase EstA (alpha/beta hydrolase family)
MLSVRLVIIYLFEFAVYCVGAFLAFRAGLSAAALLVAFLLALLFLRFLIVAVMFAVAWHHRSPWPPELEESPRGMSRLFLREFAILVALYSGFMLFEPVLRRKLSDCPKPGGPMPVLFVHGFFCNSGYWWSLLRFLRTRGQGNLFTINLVPVHGSIDSFAEQVRHRVAAILSATGHEKIVLVGHSMGGLVARAYYTRHGGAGHVVRIISLGAPHRGTRHASLSRAQCALDMRVGSQWLVDLEKVESEGNEGLSVPITSIYTVHDNIVSPQNSGELVHARNIALAGMGHLSLGWDRTVQELVAHELAPAAENDAELQNVAVEPLSNPLIAPSNESIPS